jgi:iron complex transport system substrate-binding protein
MKKIIIIMLILPVLTLSAQRIYTDALGRKLTSNNPAARIISLSPSVTEILFAIGAGKMMVGRTAYCDYPEAVKNIPVVGGFSGATVSVEQIALLGPDLVIISADMHQRLIPLLESLSIAVFAVEPRNFDEVYAVINTLGNLTGLDAAHVINTMKAKIETTGNRVKGKKRVSVFWELSISPLLTSGGNTFVNEAIKRAGGRNIFEDSTEMWPQVSIEQIILRSPDWILGGDDQKFDALSVPLWRYIPAVKNRRIAFLDANLIYRYGPRLADAVVEIARILH